MSIKNKTKSLRNSIGLIRLMIVSTLLAACNLPKATPVLPTSTNVPTDTAAPPLNTPTPTLSSPTPNPTATVQGGITNLVFDPGTTAVVAQGDLQPNQSQTFTLQAGQNQAMILLLNSTNGGASLAVYEPNGNALLDPSKKWSSWQWLLPKSELYTINVNAGASAESFILTAKVAARVTFAPGTTTATVAGSTPKGYVISYAIHGAANQTMSISLDAPGNTCALDIFGLAYGEILLSDSADALTWTGTLPSNEDYIIEVVPKSGQVINFNLNISIN